MDQIFDILIQVFTFGLVVTGVLIGQRSLMAALAVRRRMGTPGRGRVESFEGGILKSDTVENGFLQWVQSALLTDSADRSKLRRDLALAGFDHPAAPAAYVATRLSLAIGIPFALIIGPALAGRPIQGLGAIVFPLALCGLGLILPRTFISRRAKARREALEFQFPDALDLLVVCVEAGLGLEAGEALAAFALRTGSPDAHFFAVSIAIQAETGGNLAEILGGLANVMRGRITLGKRVRALASEGRASAILLSVLPVGMVLVQMLTNPTVYSSKFSDPIFWPVIGVTACVYLVGWIMVRRIINFKY